MEIQPLLEGQFFHIYNRGINKENLFKEKKNYSFFLQQYEIYCSEVLETYAYCLLKNHFHMVVYVREMAEVPRKDGKGMIRLNASRQLSHFFNSYAQSINKEHGRTGSLFESPFERKLIDDDEYLRAAICYSHLNPQLHGFVNDFTSWEFSSYQAIINNNNRIVATQMVKKLFVGELLFTEAHITAQAEKSLEKYQADSNWEKIYISSSSPAASRTAAGIK